MKIEMFQEKVRMRNKCDLLYHCKFPLLNKGYTMKFAMSWIPKWHSFTDVKGICIVKLDNEKKGYDIWRFTSILRISQITYIWKYKDCMGLLPSYKYQCYNCSTGKEYSILNFPTLEQQELESVHIVLQNVSFFCINYKRGFKIYKIMSSNYK